MRRDPIRSTTGHEAGGVVVLVRADRDAERRNTRGISKHLRSAISLGGARGQRHLRVDDQAVSVVGQYMTHITEHRSRSLALAKQACLLVRRGLVRLVAALLPVPVVIRRGRFVWRRAIF